MTVYAYIRVSTEMQNHASQMHEISTYCQFHDIKVDKWVTESISGTVAIEKRLLGKIFGKMKRGDMIICTELSRLGRNMLMIMGILNKCSEKGISIQTIRDNFSLSDNINSKIIAFAFALAAEIERNLISQRTKEALAVKKLEGVRLGRPPGSSRKKEVFKENQEDIIHIYDNGASLSYIARKYGIHRNTVRKYLSDFKKASKMIFSENL